MMASPPRPSPNGGPALSLVQRAALGRVDAGGPMCEAASDLGLSLDELAALLVAARRELGVASTRDAVERARAAGLLKA